MKLNLLINNSMVRSGYVNIDPLAVPGEPDKVQGSVSNLDHIADDAEATEIIALDVIDFLPSSTLEETLTNWIKKLRRGGSLTVGGVDMLMVAKAVARRDIDISQANLLLYGQQNAPWDYRKSTLTILTVVDIFRTNGLKIVQKRLDNYVYVVKAERVK